MNDLGHVNEFWQLAAQIFGDEKLELTGREFGKSLDEPVENWRIVAPLIGE